MGLLVLAVPSGSVALKQRIKINSALHRRGIYVLLTSELVQRHWNQTPLYLQESERYSAYLWLSEAAELLNHRGERVLEIMRPLEHGGVVLVVKRTKQAEPHPLRPAI